MPAAPATRSNRWRNSTFNHAALDINTLIKAGKTKITFDAVGIDRATEYAAEKADIVLRLWQVLKPRLAAEQVLTVYETLERPLVAVLARMERRGISIDRQVLSRLSGEFAQEAAGLEAEINEIAGETVNPGSPKQLGDILFGKLGLPGGTKTKTGQWATGARALEELAEQGHKLPQKILDWRQVSKLKSTYTDALPGFVNPTTHRVHTNYALASTTTGRLSSSDPNLQNIPVRTEDGRKIRRAFIAAPGTKLVSADYSQIELRLLAEIAEHRAAAKGVPRGPRHSRHDRVGNVRRADQEHAGRNAPPRQGDQFRHRLRHFRVRARQPARHRPRRGRRLYQKIFRAISRHPRLHRGVQEIRKGERLRADAVRPQMPLSGNQAHRTPRSVPSTSAPRSMRGCRARAADIIRRAMIRMDDALAKNKLAAQMLLQVHDELVFEVPDAEVERTLPVVKKVMEDAPLPAVSLSVPLQVEAHAADNWDAAH